jgi:hypothetical protein
MSTVTSETATITPAAGWYRLQACTDEVETYTDLEPDRDADHQDSIGYADDTGGIWMKAAGQEMPAEVLLEVWPVDADPARDGLEVVYDGQYHVEDIDKDDNRGSIDILQDRPDGLGVDVSWRLKTSLEPGTWRAVIQTDMAARDGLEQGARLAGRLVRHVGRPAGTCQAGCRALGGVARRPRR